MASERYTVPLYKSKIFISGSRPILVFIYQWISSDFSFDDGSPPPVRPRRADSKNGIENYQGPTNSGENVIQKFKFSPYIVLNLRLITA
jgi:hypothetical protein